MWVQPELIHWWHFCVAIYWISINFQIRSKTVFAKLFVLCHHLTVGFWQDLPWAQVKSWNAYFQVKYTGSFIWSIHSVDFHNVLLSDFYSPFPHLLTTQLCSSFVFQFNFGNKKGISLGSFPSLFRIRTNLTVKKHSMKHGYHNPSKPAPSHTS